MLVRLVIMIFSIIMLEIVLFVNVWKILKMQNNISSDADVLKTRD